jgi:alpha-galactosidase
MTNPVPAIALSAALVVAGAFGPAAVARGPERPAPTSARQGSTNAQQGSTNALQGNDPPSNGVWLDSLDLTKAPLRRPRGGRGQAAPAPPLTFVLGGVTYAHAVPLQSDGDLEIDLGGAAARFMAMVGIDDSVKAPQGSVIFGVWVDGKKVEDTGVVRGGDAPKMLSIDLTGAKRLVLATIDANDGTQGDSAEWAGAVITMVPGRQEKPRVLPPEAGVPPPIASSRSPVPQLNYPRITGATPGRPFLFRIPAGGDGPLTFSAPNLPAGVQLDPKTGIISGSLKGAGRTVVHVTVSGPKGKTTGDITIVAGPDALALTPPLGWNSWNVWAAKVDDAKVRAAADAIVSTGLASQGYTYVNIDDAWEGARNADGEITSNDKFPDMNALTDYVHSKGLKIGLYSSPGPRTCQQKYAGSWQHEEQDAKTWSRWGFDYIKYDWCSYTEIQPDRTNLEGLKKPYQVMRAALDTLDRDFVFSMCQYGMGNVWEWGDEVGGNLWRVTGDITDTWPSMSSIGFQQTGHEKYAGPGHWNDTDMLVVGMVGWGRGESPRPTQLTPDEQITHISLWALQAAPMLIGADLSQADTFTIDLLGNREVLGVDQDVLGKAARRIASDGWTQVWARPLEDGTMAVGLFNRGPVPVSMSVKLSDLELTGSQPVRLLWTQKDAPAVTDAYTATVPRHGAVLVKIGKRRAS